MTWGAPENEQQTLSHMKGTSAVCFILTSSIVIHTLDNLKAVYINIFSCKEFAPDSATNFAQNWFEVEAAIQILYLVFNRRVYWSVM